MDFLAIQNRARFFEIWKQASQGEPLQGEDALFARIMREHPQFHPLFNMGDSAFDIDFAARREVNPFLHTSLHAVVEQQLSSGAPPEVAEAFRFIQQRGDDPHEAIHRIGGILAEILFEAIRRKRPIDEAAYLQKVRELTF